MLTETHFLRDDDRSVFLTSYLLGDSPENRPGVPRPAVLICPGGAYLFTSDREAEPVALRFAAQGYHAFVLRYSVGEKARFPRPLHDLGRALALVRKNAGAWLVDPGRIAVCGFSAGAHLTATLGTHWNDDELAVALGVPSEVLKPDLLILGYPVTDYPALNAAQARDPSAHDTGWNPGLTKASLFDQSGLASFGTAHPDEATLVLHSPARHVSAATPPTFLWHTADDELVYGDQSLHFALALANARVPYELHIFQNGPHGLSLADETSGGDPRMVNPAAAQWVPLVLTWLRSHWKSVER